MARKKRSSKAVELSERRLAGLRSIKHNLDLGNGFSLAAYRQLIHQTRQELEDYNTALSVVDKAYNRVEETEKRLKEFSEGMLIAVAYQYGKNSHEYEMAGGTRRQDRKRNSPISTEEVVTETEVEIEESNGLVTASQDNGVDVN